MIPLDLVWALDERAARVLSMRATDAAYMAAAAARPQPDRDAPLVLRHGAYSELAIEGVLCRGPMPSGGPPTYGMLLHALSVLEADGDAHPVLLRIDSPGGATTGLGEVAVAVARLSSRRRVVAYCDDRTCSAAYLLASQATEVVSSPMADVGGIGTYAVVVDASKAAEAQGLTYHVLSSGGVKGGGVLGSPVSKEYLAEVQGLVDVLTQWFVESVARGRGLSIDQAKKLADGRVHVGQAAVDVGLVDRLSTLYDLRLQLGGQTTMTQPAAPPAAPPPASATTTAPAPAAAAPTPSEAAALAQVRTEVQAALSDVAAARAQLETDRAALRLERAGLRVDQALAETSLAPPLQARARELAVGLLAAEVQVEIAGQTVAAGDAVLDLLSAVGGEGTLRYLLEPAAGPSADEASTPRTTLTAADLAEVEAAGVSAEEAARIERKYLRGQR